MQSSVPAMRDPIDTLLKAATLLLLALMASAAAMSIAVSLWIVTAVARKLL